MEETDPFLNTNPFAELGDDDYDDPSNNSTTSNPTPQQHPPTAAMNHIFAGIVTLGYLIDSQNVFVCV